MRRPWYGHDTGLALRMALVMLLLAALYLAFVLVLWASGVDTSLVVALAAAMLGVQYFFSDRLALWTMGAREVRPAEAPELHALVERLAQSADLPKPRLAIAPTAVPNAFATGRGPGSAVVAVTSGLLQTLDGPELESVLAHELAHVKNRDVAVMTLASFFAVVAQMLLRSFYWQSLGTRRRRDGNALLLIYGASLVVWVVSFFLIRALSRYRELAADRGAAILTGAPSQLAAALLKISGGMQRIPARDLREVEALNAFFIVPALTGSGFLELFSTHPSLERRLEQLARLQEEMERPR
ncbi:MAG: zinc metalloprotease HtpX [Chloroflexi bacterium]|nr:zinc metalloprotease HtpX [Chloroflexota bacterium]